LTTAKEIYMLGITPNKIKDIIPQDRLYSLRALQTPSAGRTLARWMMGIGFIGFALLFLPWQQNIHGNGSVTALSPANRPQTVQSIIAGQIVKWNFQEGQYVKQGDTLMVIGEIKEKYFDPQFLARLKEQMDAKSKSLNSKLEKSKSLENQIAALKQVMKTKGDQALAKLEAEKVKFQNAENQFQRNKKLYEAGNIPLTKYQDMEYKFQGSQAEYLNAKIEVDQVRAEYLDKISKAESDLNNTLAELFDAEGELSKIRNEYTNMQIRNQQYHILAPQNGFVVKAAKAGLGETIKEGDPVCSIMPDQHDLAVEMYVKAMDVPLLSKGRKVRIQFDGWPALQFSGWPSVSVGTFGGVVQVIDYVNTKPGEFRILVVPDPNDDPWPEQLRMGGGIKGWVMLENVRVWFEMWRQLNGFPPSLYQAPEGESVEKKSDGNGK
jgi:multidrug resistance efflux pump